MTGAQYAAGLSASHAALRGKENRKQHRSLERVLSRLQAELADRPIKKSMPLRETAATSMLGGREYRLWLKRWRSDPQSVVISRRGESMVRRHLPNAAAVDLKPTDELPMTTVRHTAAGNFSDDVWIDDVEPDSDEPCLTGRSAPIKVALADANRRRSATRINRCEPPQLPIAISSDEEFIEIDLSPVRVTLLATNKVIGSPSADDHIIFEEMFEDSECTFLE